MYHFIKIKEGLLFHQSYKSRTHFHSFYLAKITLTLILPTLHTI